MTTEHPLRLATGSHRAGSGKGCAMNVLSWENGDTLITDTPACSDRMLARIVQRVNDAYCAHRDGDLLCPPCSIEVLAVAHRTFGTGTVAMSELDRRRVWVRVAADQARQVLHLAGDRRVAESAIIAAERWADAPTKGNVAYAYAAASAASASAYAAAASAAAASASASAYAASAASASAYAASASDASANAGHASAAAAYAASASDASAYAAYASAAADYAASASDAADYAASASDASGGVRMTLAHRAITKWHEYAAITEPPTPTPDTVNTAIQQMEATT